VDPGDELRLSWNDDIADRIGHGTACSQIIHRQAPGAQIVPLRVFGQRLETSPETILAALTWAIENRCQVINLSLGTRSPGALRPFYRLSKRAHDLGQIIVSALPRGGDFSYPAAFEPVLGVTVGDVHGPFDFHYFEDDAAEVHAYGRHRTSWQGTSQTQQGSSFAAPHLSGIVARLLEKEPGLDLAGVRRCLAEMAAARQRGSRQGADRT
jgi:subtilisin family serine protease